MLSKRALTVVLAAVMLMTVPTLALHDTSDHPRYHRHPHHHVYLKLKASLPKVERRLKEWRIIAHREAKTLATGGHDKLRLWRHQLTELDHDHGLRLVEHVNRLVNADVQYVTDWKHHHERDVWEGPVETLEEGGDCEDYALLKATMLAAKGWPANRKHLVAGILDGGEAHMMLAVETQSGQRYLLDNRINKLHLWPYDLWKPVYEIGGHERPIRYIDTQSPRFNKHSK